jgi:ATP-dependent DNA helicase RecG
MNITVEQLESLLEAKEGENLEFKAARTTYSFEDLAKYCTALANEGGGKIILGVTDRRPRKVVGTHAFDQPERTRKGLIDKLRLSIDFSLVNHPQGRVLIFEVPSRPIGTAIRCDGVPWSRSGDSLVPIPDERLRNIFAEAGHDFSADVCQRVTLQDLDPAAIEDFRRRWIEKSSNKGLASLTPEQLLRDAELLVDDGLTYAALVLFGSRKALGKYLGQAEVVFEYRSSDSSGPAQQRKEYREGFFLFYDDVWNTINLRNDLQHYQDGFFVRDIPTFAERPVREAILNAVSHRDYQMGGNVFVRQYQRRLMVESPGGFPAGITLENILDRQSPRNRRIADSFAKSGLVERSGQGMNLMFEQSIQQGKPRPAFTGTDAFNVVLTLHGEVQDPRFVQFLEKVGREMTVSFSTQDFLLFDIVHRDEPIPPALQSRLRNLVDLGVVESVGRGRGARHILSRRFYAMIGRRGVYTRKIGLDKETNKTLLLKHIRNSAGNGCTFEELAQVIPGISRGAIQYLLRELRGERLVRLSGQRRWARWYPVGDAENHREA